MKKTIILLLDIFCLIVLTSCFANTNSKLNVTAPYNTEKSQYAYEKKSKTLTINYFDEEKIDINSVPWIDINNPENIVLKDGITNIPDFMFSFREHGNGGERLNYYDRIKTVKLPDTLNYIGWDAFNNCKKLEKINIPKRVKKIGMTAFQGCVKLKRITINGNVKKLEFETFESCKDLKEVILMNGVKTIGDSVFSECKTLEKVKMANSITSIGKSAFMGCTKLKEITISKSIKKIGEKALGYKNQDDGIKGFIIKGYKGTAAEKYAKKNNFKFIALKK